MKTKEQFFKDKGGRPPDDRLKLELPYIVKKLKRATTSMILRDYEKSGHKSNLDTVRRYLNSLSEDGVIKKNVISERVILYEVR